MRCFFFECQDGDHVIPDGVGSLLPSFDAAREEAIRTLQQLAMREVHDGECQTIIITVTDDAGAGLYRATLSFQGEVLRPWSRAG